MSKSERPLVTSVTPSREGVSARARRALRSLGRRGVILTSGVWALPLVAIMRVVRPVVLIRLGTLEMARIGESALCIAYHMSRLEVRESKTLDLYWLGPSSNRQWRKMVKKVLPVVQLAKYVDRWNTMLPGGHEHHRPIDYPVMEIAERLGYGDFRMPFSDRENTRGVEWLARRGWTEGEPFVCLLIRDDAFLQNDPTVSLVHSDNEQERWQYHDYRDSNVQTYRPAAEWLADQGVWVLRMGKRMKQELESSHPRIIDYAFDPGRSDFMDIWLFANCTGCISTGTGPDTVAAVYARPILYVNYIPIGLYANYSPSITVPKTLKWVESSRELTLAEYLENAHVRTNDYEDAGIEIVDLSAEEILEGVREFWQRLVGEWIDRESDTRSQQDLWAAIQGWSDWERLHGVQVSHDIRVGSSWLQSREAQFLGGHPTGPA